MGGAVGLDRYSPAVPSFRTTTNRSLPSTTRGSFASNLQRAGLIRRRTG